MITLEKLQELLEINRKNRDDAQAVAHQYSGAVQILEYLVGEETKSEDENGGAEDAPAPPDNVTYSTGGDE